MCELNSWMPWWPNHQCLLTGHPSQRKAICRELRGHRPPAACSKRARTRERVVRHGLCAHRTPRNLLDQGGLQRVAGSGVRGTCPQAHFLSLPITNLGAPSPLHAASFLLCFRIQICLVVSRRPAPASSQRQHYRSGHKCAPREPGKHHIVGDRLQPRVSLQPRGGRAVRPGAAPTSAVCGTWLQRRQQSL